MQWIKITDKKPTDDDRMVVALSWGRKGDCGSEVNDYIIRILWNDTVYYTLDYTEAFYPANESMSYYDAIIYWMPLKDFPFPEEYDFKLIDYREG